MTGTSAGRFRLSQMAASNIFFLALPMVLFFTFYIFPIIGTVVVSLFKWDGISPRMTYVGLLNYEVLARQPRFYNALINNIHWLIFLLIVPTGLGLALAALLDRGLRFESVYKVIFFLPFTIPAVAVASIWRWIYEPTSGLLTTLLQTVGLGSLAQNWLGSPAVVNYSLMGSVLWWTTGFAFIVFFSGLRNIPVECIEAAEIEGATPWQIFWKVSFPLLWPSTIVVMGVAGIDAMRLFDVVWAMTNGGPAYASEVLATQMYDVAFGRLDMGRASAISVYLLLISGVIILPYIIYMSRRIADNDG